MRCAVARSCAQLACTPTLSPSPRRPMTKEETNAPLTRRAFCASAAAAAALALVPTRRALAWGASNDALFRAAASAPKPYPIGLELYSVRQELARDLPATLRAVSQMGYQVVEFYAPYLGWTI